MNPQDRALTAVRRVRAARETDSRIGLQQALATSRQRQEDARAAARRLQEAPGFGGGGVADFHAHRALLASLAHGREQAEQAAAGSRTVAEEAGRRWQHDRGELRVVELLLDRRARERAAERDRREARELDDLATQGWLRRAREEAAR